MKVPKVFHDTIIRNAIKTPDGTVLVSYTRHDFKTHQDANGKMYGVDGGTNYLRRIGAGDFEDQSVTIDDTTTIDEVTKLVEWGTYGKDGDQPLTFVPIADMATEHIEAVLMDERMISHLHVFLMINELQRREGTQAKDTNETSSTSSTTGGR